METVLVLHKNATGKIIVAIVVTNKDVSAKMTNLPAIMETVLMRSIIAIQLTIVGMAVMKLAAIVKPLHMLLAMMVGASLRHTNVIIIMIAVIGVTKKTAPVMPTSLLAATRPALILWMYAMAIMIVEIGVTNNHVVTATRMK